MAIVSLGGFSFALAAPEPTPQNASKEAVREAFRFSDPKSPVGPPSENDETINDAHEIVVMDKVTVTDSLNQKSLEQSLGDRSAAETAEKFQWNRGGLIAKRNFGRYEAEVGLWPKLDYTTPGKLGTQKILLRVEVLHLKW